MVTIGVWKLTLVIALATGWGFNMGVILGGWLADRAKDPARDALLSLASACETSDAASCLPAGLLNAAWEALGKGDFWGDGKTR